MMKHSAHKRILLLLFCAVLAWLPSAEPQRVSRSGVEQLPSETEEAQEQGKESGEPEEAVPPLGEVRSEPEEASPGGEEESSVPEEPSAPEEGAASEEEPGGGGQDTSSEEEGGEQEPEEEEENPGQDALPKELDAESVIVSTFLELSNALSKDNGYVNVYLADDIFISSGINIHPSKKAVLVDGIDPTDPAKTVHTLTDTGGGQASTIRVYSNEGPKSVTVRNMNIHSKNWYGTFNVEDAAQNVTTTYDSITYLGPQISFNRPGLVRYIGDTSITIDYVAGGNDRNEVAEAGSVEIGGNVTINHTTTVSSCFYIFGTESYINILPYADVTLNIEARELFYANEAPVAISVGDYASVEINSPYGLAYRETATRHRVASLDIGKGAVFRLTTKLDPEDRSPIRMVGDIVVEEGATFQVFAPFAARTPLITFTGAGTGITCNDPDSVILYTGGTAPLMRWMTGSGYVDLQTRNLSYWQDAAPIGVAGTLDDPPFSRWQRSGLEGPFTLRATVNTNYAITALETNYTADDGPVAPSETTLSFKNAKVMALGRLPLVLGGILEGTDEIIGTTKSQADLRVQYPLGGASRTLEAQADFTGLFEVPVSDYLEALSVVTVSANRDYLTRVEDMVVTPYDNTLFFLSLPEELHFARLRLSGSLDTVPRLGDFTISIADRRQYGGYWSLLVREVQPMTAGPGRELAGGFVYVDEAGKRWPLDHTSLPVASGENTGHTDVVLEWGADEGILLEAEPGNVYAGRLYEGVLSWTLSDTP